MNSYKNKNENNTLGLLFILLWRMLGLSLVQGGVGPASSIMHQLICYCAAVLFIYLSYINDSVMHLRGFKATLLVKKCFFFSTFIFQFYER